MSNDFKKASAAQLDRILMADAANTVAQGRRQFEVEPVVPMLVDPVKAQLIGMFDKLDQRGRQAVLTCAAFHLKYPKDGV